MIVNWIYVLLHQCSMSNYNSVIGELKNCPAGVSARGVKKLENFGGHLVSEDDHSYWAPPYWNITKETFLWVELNSKSNCKIVN